MIQSILGQCIPGFSNQLFLLKWQKSIWENIWFSHIFTSHLQVFHNYLVQLLVSRSHILNHFKFGEWAWKKKQLKLIDWFDFFVLFLNFSSFLNDLNLIRSVVYLVNSSSIIELGLIQIDVHIWEGKQKKITCY